MKLINILKESLNLKAGIIYPEISLNKVTDKVFNGYEILNKKGEEIGVVQVENIDGINNVIYAIFIEEQYRGKNYAIPTYVKLAKILGTIHSGEYNNDETPTRFVSNEANNIWKRLKEIFKVEKVPIQGNKFRYSLNKKNI